jgi:hypothetical protein
MALPLLQGLAMQGLLLVGPAVEVHQQPQLRAAAAAPSKKSSSSNSRRQGRPAD